MSAHPAPSLHACPRCGLIQQVPLAAGPHRAVCCRCRAGLDHEPPQRSLALPAALALAALILYPPAMALPVLEITRLGHTRHTTIWSGVVQMFSEGHRVIALIVLLCSVVIPLAKILGIFALCAPFLRGRLAPRHQALTYQTIDLVGRWGMIDVLLVAILIAAVKLGDWVNVTAGPGIIAFAAVVVLSLLASLTFDPRAIWPPARAG